MFLVRIDIFQESSSIAYLISILAHPYQKPISESPQGSQHRHHHHHHHHRRRHHHRYHHHHHHHYHHHHHHHHHHIGIYPGIFRVQLNAANISDPTQS